MLDLNLPPTHKSGLDLVGFERSVSSVDMNDSKDEFQVVSSFLAFPSFPTFCRFCWVSPGRVSPHAPYPPYHVTVASEPERNGVFLTRSCVHVTVISCGVV